MNENENYSRPTAASGSPDTTTLYDKEFNPHYYVCDENYIFLHHTGTFILLPSQSNTLVDTMAVSFSQESLLGRSAPIYSYGGSGPRQISFNFKFHREMMKQINYGISNIPDGILDRDGFVQNEENDDYVDTIIKYLQGAALPEYQTSGKVVNPPLVSVRMGRDLFIKGVVNGTVSVTYELPILKDGRYAVVSVAFTVYEIDPFSASDVMNMGSYRGDSTTLEGRIWLQGTDINTEQTTQDVNEVENTSSIVPEPKPEPENVNVIKPGVKSFNNVSERYNTIT